MRPESVLIERVHVLLDAPDARVEAVVDVAERTAREHVMQGESWLLRDEFTEEDDEELLEAPSTLASSPVELADQVGEHVG